jgi:hypothetical protein
MLSVIMLSVFMLNDMTPDLQFDVRSGVSLDVDHEGGGGVDDQLGVPQLDQEDGLVGALPLLPLSRSH